jgi:MSHA biogenesis protein MshK
MDEVMKHRQGASQLLLELGLVLAIALQAGVAQAQGLVDPTRPPPEAASAGPATAAAPAPLVSEPRLQSILISKRPGGRRVAVIDGQTLRVGDRINGARLVSLSETEAVLERGGKGQVLKLFGGQPPAEEKEAAAQAAKPAFTPSFAPPSAPASPPAAVAPPPAVAKPQPAPVPQKAPAPAPVPARGDPNML